VVDLQANPLWIASAVRPGDVVDEAVVAVNGLQAQFRHQPVVEADACLEAIGPQHHMRDAVDLHDRARYGCGRGRVCGATTIFGARLLSAVAAGGGKAGWS
jgi:hypothetical protein